MAGAQNMKVNTIYTAIDKMTATHRKIEQSNSKMSRKVEANLARMERKFRAVGDRAMKLGRQSLMVGTAIIAPLVMFANEAVKFEKSMGNISTIIDTNVEDIDKMGEKILDMSTTLPVPIEELTSSLYDIRSAGIAVEDQFKALDIAAKLSVAGLSTTSEATNILTSSMNAFKGEGKSSEEIANILFKTVKFGKTTIAELTKGFGAVTSSALVAKVSLAELSAATSALTSVGVPTAQSQTMLKALFSEMARDTGKLAQGYEKLVGSNIDVDTTTLGYHETLMKLFDATGRNELAFKNLFSSVEGGGAAYSLVTNASESYLSTLADMESGTDSLTGAFEKQQKTTSSQFQLAKNQFQALAITLGQALLPIVNDLMKAVMPMVKSFGQWARRNKALMGTIFKVAAAAGGLALVVSGVAFTVGIATKAIVVARFAMSAYKVAVVIATAAQKLWILAMAANPILLAIIAVAALAVAVGALSMSWKKTTTEQKLNQEVQERVIDRTADQIAESAVLFETLRRVEAGTELYTQTLAKLEELQPGIIEKYNLQAGALQNINAAEVELRKNILKRAEAEVKAEMLKEKIRDKVGFEMELESKGLTKEQIFQGPMGGQIQEDYNNLEKEIELLTTDVTANELEKFSPEKTTREELLEKKESVEKMGISITADGLPDWIKVHVQPGDFGGSMPDVSPTN